MNDNILVSPDLLNLMYSPQDAVFLVAKVLHRQRKRQKQTIKDYLHSRGYDLPRNIGEGQCYLKVLIEDAFKLSNIKPPIDPIDLTTSALTSKEIQDILEDMSTTNGVIN